MTRRNPVQAATEAAGRKQWGVASAGIACPTPGCGAPAPEAALEPDGWVRMRAGRVVVDCCSWRCVSVYACGRELALIDNPPTVGEVRGEAGAELAPPPEPEPQRIRSKGSVERDARAWAIEQGRLPVTATGRPSRQLVVEYCEATGAELPPPPVVPSLPAELNAAVRRWAAAEGIPVATVGRISQRVVDAYRAAHPEPRAGGDHMATSRASITNDPKPTLCTSCETPIRENGDCACS